MSVTPAVRRRVTGWPLLVGLAVALVAMTVLAAGSGQLAVPPDEVLGSLLHGLGIDLGPMPSHPQGDNALWAVRFPRVALAVVVGACLAVAGAMLQGVFGNPLAEPAVVGVSSGAAVGACAVLVAGVSFLGNFTVAAAAFLGGLATTLVVYLLARSGGRTEVVTLVLTGIAVNAFAFGVIAFLTFAADPQAREQIVFWQLGSLNGATGQALAAVTPLAVTGLVIAATVARRLDLLALGEGPARHLGVDVERLRLLVVVGVALLVGSGVAFAGIVGFVGLVVPHLIRMIAGPAHGVLLAASALGGALVLVSADLLARTAIENAELPLGMLTSLVGGPFFFWLLRRTRSRQGGWA
ncbi:heme ABC transporter permease [Actinophytocola xinjiangensis]|uniref:Heme ABC transporter permease n=1 Tax=Actinophytocola xinjiangensis TaxID=485602 RepID=A0A7Z0WKK8_9PSEU|nr:iron ABC transporter permease [Actinophytocola xinjiangensis]OLF08781.1 heme ABC transporter permease [Actinophytocola xinjiangensis]